MRRGIRKGGDLPLQHDRIRGEEPGGRPYLRATIPPFSLRLNVDGRPAGRRAEPVKRDHSKERDAMWGEWIPLVLITIVVALYFLGGGGG